MRELHLLSPDIYLYTNHPDGLCCPICGCSQIYDWPELSNWNNMTKKEKKKYEKCPCCHYGLDDFPYEEFE